MVFHVSPGFACEPEAGRRLVAAVHHAILATDILRDAIDDAVIVPLHLGEQFLVAGVMAVGHQVARALPAADVAGGNGPGRAGEIALAGQELEINRRAEEGEPAGPVHDLAEFLHRHLAGEEEIFRLEIQPGDHVLLGGVVLVAGGNGVAIDAERGEVGEHLLDLGHVGLFIDRGVGGHLVAEDLRHADGEDALLEDALALDDEIMRALQAVEMDIPVHPAARGRSPALRRPSGPCEFPRHPWR